jgi:hypothetical protein
VRGKEPENPDFRTNLILPEALIAKAYSILSNLKLSERFTSESDARDDIYGEYPFILYKHFFITRSNINKFCKMIT